MRGERWFQRLIQLQADAYADDVGVAMDLTKQSVEKSNSSREVTYATLNPSFAVQDIYCTRKHVTEAFTSLRVCDHHSLVTRQAIGTGGTEGAFPWRSGCYGVVLCKRNYKWQNRFLSLSHRETGTTLDHGNIYVAKNIDSAAKIRYEILLAYP